MEDSAAAKEKDAASKMQNTKDDRARLLHLYKDPAAQVHWCNLYGILSQRDLDGISQQIGHVKVLFGMRVGLKKRGWTAISGCPRHLSSTTVLVSMTLAWESGALQRNWSFG
jgi:hypothetical protein